MRLWNSTSEDATLAIGSQLAEELAPDGVLLLFGELGSGKTVLAQGVAKKLGFERREIQSPTYTLVNEYERSGTRLVHVDLYRLEPEQVEVLGVEEVLAGPGVKVVEWADRLPFPVAGAVLARISVEVTGARRIEAFRHRIEPEFPAREPEGGKDED
ncbi:MAG: tRNA (adenosine(37)-N6)-threonylcarbamoyltransferase complex ATPase subunit type 1 TsaE [bacterium]|nr:tRNA (adenosine(37)-N6)-threonylcarbamoyltransferase complex ATPase subunit type 1 TsaE [bacterium]